MKITNPRVLDFFGFRVIEPRGKVCVDQPLWLWARCLWWKWTR